MKLLADLLENHPFSFLPVMKDALNVICRLCFTPEGEGLLFQRFIIMCFNIIKQVLLCPEYKLPKQADDTDELRNSPAFQGHTIKTEFFEPSTVTEVAKCLISQYLLLSKDDLELWDADPEQYGTNKKKIQHKNCQLGNKPFSLILQFVKMAETLGATVTVRAVKHYF